jgi:hypothetical protein
MNDFELYVRLEDIDGEVKVIFMSALTDLESYESGVFRALSEES